LEKATPNTINEPAALRSELQKVRERGYALSFQERVPGISTVAVPVRDHTGTVVAALSVSGPSSRVTRERLFDHLPLAVAAAKDLSRVLGYVER
jgi:IclR family transcriptional regulator, acetate operon repressor